MISNKASLEGRTDGWLIQRVDHGLVNANIVTDISMLLSSTVCGLSLPTMPCHLPTARRSSEVKNPQTINDSFKTP